jgi:hypothetical protein
MKVCVFGTARSGTTAIYNLLQNIFINIYGTDAEYVYEPFLWEASAFNGKYVEVQNNFKYMNSVSLEGMYNDLKLPFFIPNPGEYNNNEYLRTMFNRGAQNILLKFIRANGRFPLLQNICPECKFIFVIRNPIDVINSVIGTFSFYSNEFHQDTYGKFVVEVKKIFRKNYDIHPPKMAVHKEIIYWYYMNAFAMKSIKKTIEKPLLIGYEDYVENSEKNLVRICDYLNIDYDEKYLKIKENKVGPVTDNINLNMKEIGILKPYLNEYEKFLTTYNISNRLNVKLLLAKYREGRNNTNKTHTSNMEFTPLTLRSMMYQNEKIIDKLKNQIHRLRVLLEERNKEIYSITKSYSYRIGKLITLPGRLLRNLFR